MTRSDSIGGTRPSVRIERLDRPGAPSLELLVCRPVAEAVGTPVLFLHGAFAGAWCWKESWLPRTSESGRFAAAVSLRGHGRSAGRERLAWATLADFVDDLAHAIHAMPSAPIVVAHSLGGLLAQQLLSRVIDGSVAIRGLVLVGSLPPEGLALLSPWLGLTAWFTALSGTMGVNRASVFVDRWKHCGDDTWNATTAAARAACAGDVALTALTQALVPCPAPPAWLAKVPLFVLRGAHDPLIDAMTCARTAAYHGGAFVSIPEAGHYPMLGRHSTAGADALLRWIDQLTTGDRPNPSSGDPPAVGSLHAGSA